jgi:hypothetical protein
MSSVSYSSQFSGWITNARTTPVYKYSAYFLDDASPGTFSDFTTASGDFTGGILQRVTVKAGETAFNTITVTVKDSDGVTLVTGTLTATGELEMDGPKAFTGQLTISLSGNGTANANGYVNLYLV